MTVKTITIVIRNNGECYAVGYREWEDLHEARRNVFLFSSFSSILFAFPVAMTRPQIAETLGVELRRWPASLPHVEIDPQLALNIIEAVADHMPDLVQRDSAIYRVATGNLSKAIRERGLKW